MTETERGVAKTADPGILQITSFDFDERFYQRVSHDGEKEVVEYAPSVTHALGAAWPPSAGLQKWIGDVGNERAEEIKEQAGEEGDFVHQAAVRILEQGEGVTQDEINERFKRGPRALKIKRCLKALLAWRDEVDLEVITMERVTWAVAYVCTNAHFRHPIRSPRSASLSDAVGKARSCHVCGAPMITFPFFAGTIDLEGILTWKGDRVTALVDFKTSRSIHDTHKAQVAAYRWSEGDDVDLGFTLHLGNQTKRQYSFNEVDQEQWEPRAIGAISTYHLHNPNARPSDEVFPEVFQIEESDDDDSPAAA